MSTNKMGLFPSVFVKREQREWLGWMRRKKILTKTNHCEWGLTLKTGVVNFNRKSSSFELMKSHAKMNLRVN